MPAICSALRCDAGDICGGRFGARIFDRDRRDVWEMKGSKSQAQKAREKATAILEKHRVPPLPAGVLREMDVIVTTADSRHT